MKLTALIEREGDG